MRTIVDLNILPPTLSPTGSGGKTHHKNEAIHLGLSSGNKKFDDHWKNEDVRGVLYASQWRVCAYCLRSLPGNDRGDVEHFRPKKAVAKEKAHGGYWWLTYRLSNYFLSCSVCNRTRKGNKFPLVSGTSRATFETDSDVKKEQRILFDPRVDDIDSLLKVDLEGDLLPVSPVSGLPSKRNSQLLESIKFFRINSDQFLIRNRLRVFKETWEAWKQENFFKAQSLAVRYSPQSIVGRQLLAEIAPHLVPDQAFEVTWLLNQIATEIGHLTIILENDPNDTRSKIEFDESLWTLAALLKSPPDGDKKRVKSFCTQLGVLKRVDALSKQFN